MITEEIKTTIEKYDKIIVHRHANPDPDALGSQRAIALSLRKTFPNKTILMAGNSVGDLNWLSEMDNVTEEDYQGSLVIVVDTANTPRISGEDYDKGDFLIKIDHHPDNDQYGDLRYVLEHASSCSEIMFDLLQSWNFVIDEEVANAIYAGIVGDTGRFMYDSTSAHTFAIASHLMELKADLPRINQRLSEVTLQQAKLQSSVYDYLQIDDSGAAWAIITQADLQKLGVTTEQAHAVVSTPGRLKGVVSWVIAVEKQAPETGFRIHYRSKGPVINTLAMKHDGGGHMLASGANAADEQEVQTIVSELIEVVKNYK
ncbi:bifunctional oligoribonuclease/PAP phosphatase NrnA [Lactobacillus sp. YT155]|uniref:DHH family phosphoesterase n=1 Tax=Lactobacillus sp. YT155 TaxID=3060955 RepID=UPI00265F232C|nr:bifunctional oligoribonuclease/PAP phosphatase NrnA [Lactobacillus sp. YT155]MDO1605902.1 bifunctional oligoribonuclease/PAP phosphatase NrnA [Lactobacillus sp. YT155]